MKKKLIASGILAGLLFGLVGCATVPDGVDEAFHTDAHSMFVEIDEDTMEMEATDKDDLYNLNLLSIEADTKREEAFITHMENMVALQENIHEGENLEKYLDERSQAMATMNLSDSGEEDSFTVYEFEFVED